MWGDEVCTGVHGGAWGRFSKIHGACGFNLHASHKDTWGCMAYNLTSLEASTCTRPCRWAKKEQGKCSIKGR